MNVEVGDFVEAGMEIAEVGSSEASFSMLKFQLRKNGAPVNTSTLRFR
ncbi:M23 family metallopeptidase [Gammaproteobacteria bacterium]|nr:M23 family metallopeptidase [Gammaproteobacteria bacterium]